MSTFTIEVCGLSLTGSLLDVATKYKQLKHMMGGDDGYAYQIVVYRDGEIIDMEELMEGMRRLFAPA